MPSTAVDDGATREFASGFHRDTAATKPRYSLIPRTALRRLALHFTRGADRYGENNWRNANTREELAVFQDSAYRHLLDWLEGNTDEDHAAAVLWNVSTGMDLEERLEVAERLDTIARLGG